MSQQIVLRDDPVDRWLTVERTVTTGPIVVVQPACEGRGAMTRAGERRPVRPLPQRRAKKPLGLAIRPRGVRPSATVPEPARAAGGGEGARAIAAAIVGQHAVDAHAATPKLRDGAAKKGGDGGPLLIDQHLGIRDARTVVDAPPALKAQQSDAFVHLYPSIYFPSTRVQREFRTLPRRPQCS